MSQSSKPVTANNIWEAMFKDPSSVRPIISGRIPDSRLYQSFNNWPIVHTPESQKSSYILMFGKPIVPYKDMIHTELFATSHKAYLGQSGRDCQ